MEIVRQAFLDFGRFIMRGQGDGVPHLSTTDDTLEEGLGTRCQALKCGPVLIMMLVVGVSSF